MIFTYPLVRVMRVVDGDTVDAVVDLGFHLNAAHRFRLLGVDTPERGQQGWAEATAFVQAWFTDRPHVVVESRKADAFGRWLGTFTDEDTSDDLAQDLIEAGLGVPYSR